MKECSNLKENNEKCPCKEIDCERHGTCCECIRFHKSRGSPPACLR